MNQRLREILIKIGELEKESPYNFCDRWCERCPVEKRLACKVHHIELEQDMLAAARGEDEAGSGILEQVRNRQYDNVGGGTAEGMDADEDEAEDGLLLDPEELESPEFKKIREHIQSVTSHPLPAVARTYFERAHVFLESLRRDDPATSSPDFQRDIETVAWYHTLLPVKIERGLAGFHEATAEDDPAVYDAVGQFEICKKAVSESLLALRNLRERVGASALAKVQDLLAILHLLRDHIQMIEDGF